MLMEAWKRVVRIVRGVIPSFAWALGLGSMMEERLGLSAYHSCKSFVRWGIPVELAARGSGFLAHYVVMLHWARFLSLLFDVLTFYRVCDPHGSGSWIGSSIKY